MYESMIINDFLKLHQNFEMATREMAIPNSEEQSESLKSLKAPVATIYATCLQRQVF